MYRIRNGQNVYRTVNESIYRSQRISSHTCIDHEAHSQYCVRDCYHYTPGIYAEGFIVFAFPFVRSSVCMLVRPFVRSYFRHVCRICVKVLRQSFSSGVYLSNYLPESIHIWTIVTWVGLEVKILDTFKNALSKFCFGITIC